MEPMYNTKIFTDVWQSEADYLADVASNATLTNVITTDNHKILYALLYAKYGNTPIANFDLNQWKFKVFSIIYKYGGTWQKKKQIQDTLKTLTDDQIMQGTKIINNHALNPATDPSTASLEELQYIDAQNSTNYKKGAVEAYSQLWAMLDDNITDLFIGRFAECFNMIALPNINAVYYTEEEN